MSEVGADGGQSHGRGIGSCGVIAIGNPQCAKGIGRFHGPRQAVPRKHTRVLNVGGRGPRSRPGHLTTDPADDADRHVAVAGAEQQVSLLRSSDILTR